MSKRKDNKKGASKTRASQGDKGDDDNDGFKPSKTIVQVTATRSTPKNAFAMLADDEDTVHAKDHDDEVEEEEEDNNKEAQEEESSKAKKGEGMEEEEESQPVASATTRAGKKKKDNKKNKGAQKKQVDDDEEEEEGNNKPHGATKQPEKGSKKKQQKKKKNDADDYYSQLAADDEEPSDAPKQEAKVHSADAKKAKGSKKKADASDYLAQFGENPDEETAIEKPKETKTKKEKKPKEKQATKQEGAKEPPKPSAPPKKLNEKAEAFRLLMEQKRKEEEARLEEERRIEEEEERLLQQLRDKEKQEKKVEKKATGKKEKAKIQENEALKKRREELLKSGFVAAMKKDEGKPKTTNPPKSGKPKEEQKVVQKDLQTTEQPQPQDKPMEKERDSWEELEEELNAELENKEEKQIVEEKIQAPKEEEKTTTNVDAEEKSESQEMKVKGTEDTKKGELRSPICCVLGHVDTGKTKILDKIRNTNVQKDEAGGITQQIGATYIPIDSVKKEAKKLGEKVSSNVKIPGLLIIDTPGHESFTNLRSRGTNLCDIAILVVDIMHSLERQTIESINLLKKRKVPFIVALNKIDQIYDWKSNPNTPIRETLKKQPKHTIVQFQDRVKEVIGAFNQQGYNASLYYENKDFKNYVSLVPTSAHTGEGIPDLLTLMMQITQHFMSQKITYKDEFQCTILEFKVVEGHGTTIDVILVNGIIREGDKIVVCTLNGPVVTTVRALLVPKPLREIRVKGEYAIKKEVRAALGIKIAAQDLDGAVPGSAMLLVKPGDDIEELKDMVMADLQQMLTRINKSGKGVYVQASTLGSLEALLDFLNSENIPICGINVGPVHKKDVTMASVMLDSSPEYAVIMAFDIPVTKEAQLEAEKLGVQIFTADIIYHLCDKFMAHMNKIREEKKKKTQMEIVWPCIIKIIPDHVFHKKDPITVGVDVLEGMLKIGTPLVIPTRENLEIGRCTSIHHNKVSVNEASRGKAVSIQIDGNKNISIGRQFEETDIIYSKVTRNSIDLLKEHYKDSLKKDDLKLLQKIKKILNVPDAARTKKGEDSDEDV